MEVPAQQLSAVRLACIIDLQDIPNDEGEIACACQRVGGGSLKH